MLRILSKLGPVGTAALSPGRSPGFCMPRGLSPVGTMELLYEVWSRTLVSSRRVLRPCAYGTQFAAGGFSADAFSHRGRHPSRDEGFDFPLRNWPLEDLEIFTAYQTFQVVTLPSCTCPQRYVDSCGPFTSQLETRFYRIYTGRDRDNANDHPAFALTVTRIKLKIFNCGFRPGNPGFNGTLHVGITMHQ